MKLGTRKLFVGCSRKARPVADWIKYEIESKVPTISVVIWDAKENWRNNKSALESLRLMTKDFYYALFIYYPDDYIQLGLENFFITRDNVIYESGLFFSKFGEERTFILKPGLSNHPINNEFRVLTDFDGIEFIYYKLIFNQSSKQWSVDTTDDYTRLNVDQLCKDILKKEGKLCVSKKDAASGIVQLTNLINADLHTLAQPDEYYIGNFLEKFEDLIRLKSIQIGKSLRDIIEDITIAVNKIDDVLDIRQLALEQSKVFNDDLVCVWIFADEPLEFKNPTDEHLRAQLSELKNTVLSNLKRGVKYVYFVNNKFEESSLNILVQDQTALLKNIEIIKIDQKHFLTFFTLHFNKHLKKNPAEIYVSLIDRDREDLLVKVPGHQRKRIFDNLEKIKGFSDISHYNIFDRVNH